MLDVSVSSVLRKLFNSRYLVRCAVVVVVFVFKSCLYSVVLSCTIYILLMHHIRCT